jgi:hypothetical protein
MSGGAAYDDGWLFLNNNKLNFQQYLNNDNVCAAGNYFILQLLYCLVAVFARKIFYCSNNINKMVQRTAGW